jgi:hypothetical protein
LSYATTKSLPFLSYKKLFLLLSVGKITLFLSFCQMFLSFFQKIRIFVAIISNSVESLSINEDYVDDYIHVATFVGHRLYRLAHLVSIAMCMVVEIISHCAVGLSVLYYDVWHARVIR